MFNCPFLEEHPDLFLLLIGILAVAYFLTYVLYYLILSVLCVQHQRGTSYSYTVKTFFFFSSIFVVECLFILFVACVSKCLGLSMMRHIRVGQLKYYDSFC